MATQATLPIEQAEMVAAIWFVMFLGSLGVHRYEMPYATNSDRNHEPIPENMKCIIKTWMYAFLRGKGLPDWVIAGRATRSGGEEGRKLLTDAVTAYRSALEVRTKADLPQDWAD
jgi:hypothetical protein